MSARWALFDELSLPTPVEEHGGILVKRDDLFEIAGVRGGKVRTCWHLARGATGLVTAGSRSSPQVNIVAHIGQHLGIPVRAHVPAGPLSPEVADAAAAGAEIVPHRPGWNSVIISRAAADAHASSADGWRHIPFGMQCLDAVVATQAQTANLPWDDIARIVVPVGSGMSLAGILWGLYVAERAVGVVGVVVGAGPHRRLERYGPPGWGSMVSLISSALPYDTEAPHTRLGDLELDAIYEAKCLPYLQDGDLLWDVGIRRTQVAPEAQS